MYRLQRPGGLGDLLRVLERVLGHAAGEELDGHRTKLRVSALTRPPVVGEAVEEAGDLLVLVDDHPHEVLERLPSAKVLRAIRGLVVIGEHGVAFVEKPADPEAVDHDDAVPHVDEGFPDGPLAGTRGPVMGPRGDSGEGLPERLRSEADLIEDRAMVRTHHDLLVAQPSMHHSDGRTHPAGAPSKARCRRAVIIAGHGGSSWPVR